MNRIILIKYGELTTKKGNRKLFINTLYKNINLKLKNLNVTITSDLSRMYIEYESSEEELILKKIKEVFGIHKFLIAYKTNSNMDNIKNTIKEVMDNTISSGRNYTFKVETKRSDKRFPMDSMEINYELGEFILKNFKNLQVDVHNPEIIVHVEIRIDYSYVYLNEYDGLGGYPVGTLGQASLMLSGGIDSPVAGYLAIKRGIKLNLVYFEAIPHTSLEARNKVIELAKKLAIYGGEMRLIVVPFTKLQEEIYKNVLENYPITIMRRMMYRIMEKLSLKYKSLAIVNGESIGQVASQTLTSMNAINSVTSIPVIRPVACFDKLEIIDIAKKIDTYDISILPYEDCCTVFVPRHPIINPSIEKCIEMEQKFDYETLIDEIMNNLLVIKIDENYEINKYEDVL
ncbi:MAG: tRNA 4-thiouridine(8) synthase ThiI [Bacilli bacterium]|nr:tRNA 4-thiouridine(8) synthase ThiI [Bacilli bacterium]